VKDGFSQRVKQLALGTEIAHSQEKHTNFLVDTGGCDPALPVVSHEQDRPTVNRINGDTDKSVPLPVLTREPSGDVDLVT
jgi:hypothetical protein